MALVVVHAWLETVHMPSLRHTYHSLLADISITRPSPQQVHCPQQFVLALHGVKGTLLVLTTKYNISTSLSAHRPQRKPLLPRHFGNTRRFTGQALRGPLSCLGSVRHAASKQRQLTCPARTPII